MIGGNTKKDGDVGILYLIETAADVTLFVAWMKITPADAYVVLLAESVMADPYVTALRWGAPRGVASRGPLHEGRSTWGSQIFSILTCAQY